MNRLDEIDRDLRYLGIGNETVGRISISDGLALVAVARAAVRVSNEMALSTDRRCTPRSQRDLVGALMLVTEKTGPRQGEGR